MQGTAADEAAPPAKAVGGSAPQKQQAEQRDSGKSGEEGDMLAGHAELRTKSSSSLDKLVVDGSAPAPAEGGNGDTPAKPLSASHY